MWTNPTNSPTTDITPFFGMLLLPRPFYFLPINIMALKRTLLLTTVCSALKPLCPLLSFPCPAHIRHVNDKIVLTGSGLSKLFQDCLSKPPLSWRRKLCHWLGIFAVRFHLHFAVQASRASTAPTEGSVPSQWDVKYTICSSQGREGNSWSREGP